MPVDANGAAATPLRSCDRFSSPIDAEVFCVARLLQDIIDIFRQQNAVRLRTSVIIESLSAIGRWPRSRTSSDRVNDAQKLALLLRPLLIRPTVIRFEDGIARGYLRHWFEEAVSKIADDAGICRGRQS